jgi:hypothetical protein
LLNKISDYVSGASELRIGAALSRSGVCASILRKRDGIWQVIRVQEVSVPIALFEGEPPADAVKVLAHAFTILLPEAAGTFLPLHLALPGAAVSLRLFSLDAVPKAENDRIDLVRWRLSQELAAGYELACAYQILDDAGQSGTMLGIAIDARWLACLTEACSTAQIVPTVIDAGFSYLFNHFHPEIATFQVCSALICLEAESWSMLIIDEHARIKLARSWWREPAAASGDITAYRAIALEAEQSIRAYMIGGATPIQRISIAGEGPDIKSLAAILDQRMQQPCQILAVTSREAQDNLRPEHSHYSSALAASFDTR